MPEFRKAAKKSELQPGMGREVKIEGRPVALFSVGGEVHALGAVCPHRGGPIGEGTAEGCNAVCPWHGWRFDLKTGVCPENPTAKLAVYPVKVDGEDVLVQV